MPGLHVLVDSTILPAEIDALQNTHITSFLTTLVLDDNMIGDKGATAVADALRFNFSLEILSLNRNRIGSNGAEEMGSSSATKP
ncbi:hypothetical protein T484DRAFT_1820380 [Baffinella frigidus]|nr:hypothetical protein T484DRAFT_1820380 [Cryptophyta sp. CCMP2293]